MRVSAALCVCARAAATADVDGRAPILSDVTLTRERARASDEPATPPLDETRFITLYTVCGVALAAVYLVRHFDSFSLPIEWCEGGRTPRSSIDVLGDDAGWCSSRCLSICRRVSICSHCHWRWPVRVRDDALLRAELTTLRWAQAPFSSASTLCRTLSTFFVSSLLVFPLERRSVARVRGARLTPAQSGLLDQSVGLAAGLASLACVFSLGDRGTFELGGAIRLVWRVCSRAMPIVARQPPTPLLRLCSTRLARPRWRRRRARRCRAW